MKTPYAVFGASPRSVGGGLLTCDAHVDGGKLIVVVAGKDRTGLLVGLLEWIHGFDTDANVDGGNSTLAEHYATIFLILRSRKKGHHTLDDLGEHVKKYRSNASGGVLPPPVALLSLRINAPDEPGSLLAICQRFSEMNINIAHFRIEPFADSESGPALRVGTEAEDPNPTCNVRFSLLLPSDDITAGLIEEVMQDLNVKILKD